MGEKKRKRNEDGSERPAKKAATQALPPNVHFKFIEDRNDALGPVMAATPGLSFPAELSMKAFKKGGDSIMPPGQKPAPYQLLLHSSDHPRLDYTAEQEKDGSAESLLKDYVGVYDPVSGELQLVEVRRVTVRSVLRSEVEEMREMREIRNTQGLTMAQKRHALGMEFGSKKSKKALLDMAANAVTRGRRGPAEEDNENEAVSSAILQDMSKNTATMPTNKELDAAVDEAKPRPKHNAEASSPSEVYPIESLIGNNLMTAISVKDWYEASKNGKPVNVHSRFVAKRILKLAKSDDRDSLQKLKVLRFILLCIDFNASLKMKGRDRKTVPSMEVLRKQMGESPAVDNIKRKFASENTNEMPRWNIDNLMTHIAAAALIVDNFEVDTNDLREDLKLQNKEIKQYFHELGCKITAPTESQRAKMKITKAEAGNHSIAKLQLPLNFPKVSTGPRKR